MITAALLKDLAYFYANTDRRTLEQAGLVSDDDRWQRFQHNFDIFILKLSDENRQVLADLANAYLRPGIDEIGVARFAEAMSAKLAAKRAEDFGGWHDPEQCRVEFLSRKLREHVAKGDPIDVANFAMMLHQRGSRILPPDPVSEGELLEAPPPIDIPEDIKPKVDEITAKYKFAAMTITEDLLDTGLPEYICSNIAVFNVISQAARLAVISAHAFEKREPRRDWWQVSTLAHFDEAVGWFAETLGKEMAKEGEVKTDG